MIFLQIDMRHSKREIHNKYLNNGANNFLIIKEQCEEAWKLK